MGVPMGGALAKDGSMRTQKSLSRRPSGIACTAQKTVLECGKEKKGGGSRGGITSKNHQEAVQK